jgi:hypothetical protein
VVQGGQKVTIEPQNPMLRLRIDRLILWFGSVSIIVFSLITLVPFLQLPRSMTLRMGPAAAEIAFSDSNVVADANLRKILTPPSIATSLELFSQDVAVTTIRADAIFARSTLLLVGGIIMAFIGVSIFYVTLPETSKDEALNAYWPHVVRPTGVLIFIEAISWFLLRQYRAQVEDYKWFYRLYLKRANFLAAMRILDKSPVRPEDVFIAACLVQEDLSGRLKKGESTEGLEAIKIPEDSPVTEILRTVSAVFRAPADKSKEKAGKLKKEGEE